MRGASSVFIRDSVFETNSSSSHSVTIADGEMYGATLPPDVLKSGRLDVMLGCYGREHRRYYRPENKLAYILTQLRDDVSGTVRVCRIVEEHSGCRVVLDTASREECYVDHQSEGTGLELVSDPERLVRFLFSPDSFVQTGSDESFPGQFIETDRGPEQYDADLLAGNVPDGDVFILRFPYFLDTISLETAGETICSGWRRPARTRWHLNPTLPG